LLFLVIFPDIKHPRVVWVEANDKIGQLASLHLSLNQALCSFIQAKKEDSFSDHITLGRFTGTLNLATSDFLKFTAALPSKYSGDWQATTVEIMRSDLSSNGAKHTLLLSCRLAG
jgi:2'-5' RNA ligase